MENNNNLNTPGLQTGFSGGRLIVDRETHL